MFRWLVSYGVRAVTTALTLRLKLRQLIVRITNVCSSARNFMIYQRGTKQSYQKWADIVGDESYTWDTLLPYFKKSVKFSPPSDKRQPEGKADYNPEVFTVDGGPLNVSYANYAQPFSTWLKPSLHEIGVPPCRDFNSGELIGRLFFKKKQLQRSFKLPLIVLC